MNTVLAFPERAVTPSVTKEYTDVMPELEKRFPHVVDQIIQLWPTPEIERYLQSLIVDERLGRQGFPPEAFEELLFLSDLAWVLQHGHTRVEVADRESGGLGASSETPAMPEYDPENDPFTLAWTENRQ